MECRARSGRIRLDKVIGVLYTNETLLELRASNGMQPTQGFQTLMGTQT